MNCYHLSVDEYLRSCLAAHHNRPAQLSTRRPAAATTSFDKWVSNSLHFTLLLPSFIHVQTSCCRTIIAVRPLLFKDIPTDWDINPWWWSQSRRWTSWILENEPIINHHNHLESRCPLIDFWPPLLAITLLFLIFKVTVLLLFFSNNSITFPRK
jgi:hypothetical protein